MPIRTISAPAVRLPQSTASEFQESMVALIRSLGLHQPDRTPCGQPVGVAEAHALMELAREPGLSQNALAARLRLEKSTISRIASTLERRGWIERRRDAADGRVVRLRLTAGGRETAATIAAAREAKFAAVFAAIPAAQRKAVVASLQTLMGVMRET